MTSRPNFDDFMRDIPEKAAIDEKSELFQAELEAHYDAAIAKDSPFPRFNDTDPEVQATLREAAIERVSHQVAEAIALPEGMGYFDFEAFVYEGALNYVNSSAMKESLRRVQILIVRGLYEHAIREPGSVDEALLATLKKQLIADMIIVEDFEIDSSWVHFANNFIPGEQFDPHAPEDRAYILSSLQEHTNNADEHDRIAALQREIAGIIHSGTHATIDTASTVSTLIFIGIMYRDASGREAEVVAACADLHLDVSAVARILALLQDEYPAA